MSKIQGIAVSEELKRMQKIGGATPQQGGLIKGVEQESDSTKISFGEFLSNQFSEANTRGVQAERAIQDAIAGRDVNPHSTVIAVQKASIALTLMMSIKTRLERAYQELIRMQVG